MLSKLDYLFTVLSEFSLLCFKMLPMYIEYGYTTGNNKNGYNFIFDYVI